MRTTLLLLSLLAAACSAVRTRNLCESDGIERIGASAPRDCHRCASDADCVFKGNVCEGVVFCAHRESDVVSTDLGCHPEPSAPDDGACVCRDAYCQVR